MKRARHLLTGEDVAIKVIDKDKIDEISRLHIHKEVKKTNRIMTLIFPTTTTTTKELIRLI